MGTWSSSDVAVATVSSSGLVYGVAPGTATISYAAAGSVVTTVFTVSPAPAAITGTTSFCETGGTTLSDATPGGTWSSSNSLVFTIGSSTGIATGVHAGYAYANYNVGPGCAASAYITVNTTVVDSIFGGSTVCPGSTIILTNAITGGTWSSSNPAVATISSTGVVSGVSAGYTIITYSVSGVCGVGYNTKWITVPGAPSAGSISGPATMYTGATATFYDWVSGGVWSSSNPSVATISSTGVVTAIAVGTTTISYTVSACGGSATTTVPLTVSAASHIAGRVIFGSSVSGYVKVWLIHYNPSSLMLQAYDSTMVYAGGVDTVNYVFYGVPSDSFRVKAALDSVIGSSGYVPTYHTSSYFWHSANVINHVSGTNDDNEDIVMGVGTVTSGPGFISGLVTTGANKGTSGSAPAVGLLIFLINETTGALVQQAYTDATGSYTFNNLPVGQTYKVYPELINYATTPYTSIHLTSSATSLSAASFIQHTLSHTITPIPEAVIPVCYGTPGVQVYPNPANGQVMVQWISNTAEHATITVSDVQGRVLISRDVNMAAASGTETLDVSRFNNGIYLVSVRSASVKYSDMIRVQR
jgi:uncharacterized protein YjdB